MLSTCQHCQGPCNMHFGIIFVILLSGVFMVAIFHIIFHFIFLDHSDHSPARHMQMRQK